MTISPDKWESVKALFEAALEAKPQERASFLISHCDDPVVRNEVNRLFAEHEEAGTFLSTPIFDDSTESSLSERFPDGTLLAGRFRILRFIASGGMGSVYEAQDLELRERVALKTIRPKVLDQSNAIARFRREIHLARQVTHPNVCRIFDLFYHTPEGDRAQKIVFVTMELLRGPDLDAHLKHHGPMTSEQALPLIRQMAAALAAAHAVGIVHRDFKPGNVVLVGDPGSYRAVVTDFGLALRTEPSGESRSIATGPGVVGTPAYMSPEQIEGRVATASSDIYALGLVIYEMVTGKRPFQGDTLMSAALKRLSEPPIPPRKFNSSISPAWDAVLMRCLERDPQRRFANATEVFRALAGDDTTPSRGTKANGRGSGRLFWISGTIGGMVAIALASYLFYHHPAKLTEKDTIVLADFINHSGDPVFDDTLKQGFAVDLRQSPFLNILSDDKVNRQLRYMGRQPEERLTPDLAREVCLRQAVKAMLVGSITNVGTHFVITLKAMNCKDSDLLDEEQVEADRRETVLTKLHEVGVLIRKKLGESLASVQKYDTPLQQATTASLEALQAYTAASKTFRSRGEQAAIPLYQRAIELDPKFAMAYADLAIVYNTLNEIGLSAEYAGKAYELRARVSERERFLIDTSYYMFATGQQEKAVQVFDLWKRTYPRDLPPYVNVGLVDSSLGLLDKALADDQDAFKMAPDLPVVYTNLAYDYVSLDRFDDAKAVLDQAKQRKLEDPLLPNEYQLAFLRDDRDEMQRCVSAAADRIEDRDTLLAAAADTEAFYGRLHAARELSRRASEEALRSDAKEAAANWRVTSALREAEFGNAELAQHEAASALALAENRAVRVASALAFARAGDVARAQSIAITLQKQFPTDTLLNGFWMPNIVAAIALKKNVPSQALQVLQPRSYELGGAPPPFTSGAAMYSVYLRGEAYIGQKMWSNAAAEFQEILRHRGLVWNFPLGVLAHLQLARTYTKMGDMEKSRGEYRVLLGLWKEADQDLPLRQEVQRESEALEQR